jgi:hypothetical protein
MKTKNIKPFTSYLVLLFVFFGIVLVYMYSKEPENFASFCEQINNQILDDNLKQVYVIPDVFTEEECNYIIQCSDKYAEENGWAKSRHENYPTTDNETKNIADLAYLVENRVYRKIVPEYGHHYNIPSEVLGIDETFVVKYSSEDQRLLEPHVDGCDFSFVIKLNKEYDGGNTHFLNLDKTVEGSKGSAVIFCGKNKHMGLEITSGTRYILTGFLSLGKRQFCDDYNTNE